MFVICHAKTEPEAGGVGQYAYLDGPGEGNPPVRTYEGWTFTAFASSATWFQTREEAELIRRTVWPYAPDPNMAVKELPAREAKTYDGSAHVYPSLRTPFHLRLAGTDT